jgi:hypothetical protein
MGRLEQLASLRSALEATATMARETVQVLGQATQQAAEHTNGMVRYAQEAATSISSSASAAAESARTASEEVRRHGADAARRLAELEKKGTETTQRMANQLDDLKARLGDNVWEDELKQQIALVELGAMRVDELVTKFGSAVVNGRTVRELLDGMDFSAYSAQIQGLVEGLEKGSASLDSVMKLLKENTSGWAQDVAQSIDLFKQGKVTLELVLEKLQRIKRDFPDTDFSELAEALEQALAQGRI